MLIGLISDTHGRVRDDVHEALAGCALILHAGDVGGQHVLDELSVIAPVRAVRGNVDLLDDPSLEQALDLTLDGVRVHVSHGHELGSPTPAALARRYADARVIVFGHTHVATIERIEGRLVVNPGAAGPARFGKPVSVARLTIADGEATVEVVPLEGP